MESAFRVTQGLQAHHKVGFETPQGHHLLGRSGLAHGITLLLDPVQQFFGLVGPCRQGRSEQFIVVDACRCSALLGYLTSSCRCFQEGTELVVAQRVGNRRVRFSGIKVDA